MYRYDWLRTRSTRVQRWTGLKEGRPPLATAVGRAEQFLLLGGSLLATHVLWPRLTPYRILVQVIGLAYNYRLLPLRHGFARFKELYFCKNFASACLFILTCFVYPYVVAEPALVLRGGAVAILAVFFLLFEHTYEILYDFRDLEGDKAEGIPTYPVVHGPQGGRRILSALLWLSAGVLVVGVGSGTLGVREGLMVAAPLLQWLFYRRRLLRLTSRDCVQLTHMGTALLALFLSGTAVWRHYGLVSNIYLR